VYSSCLFCRAALGSNEVIEQFPVGRRLAFDGEKGRLWVVCRRCGRWNLTPLEERWEAIEDCERRFRGTRLRTSTDHIGLTRLPEGLTLIRIGRPLRPEFSAWRYGDLLGRRRTRRFVMAGVGLSAVGLVVAGELATGIAVGSSAMALFNLSRVITHGRPGEVLARVPRPYGTPQVIRRRDLKELRFSRADRGEPGWGLFIGATRVSGPAAERTLATLLPAINRFGASREQVATAVRLIEQHPTPADYVSTTVAQLLRRQYLDSVFAPSSFLGPKMGLTSHERLALEMALHEEDERRALSGELAALAAAWREAEEIAAIADNMFLPESVLAWMRLRGRNT
jgi:hypothetical protein